MLCTFYIHGKFPYKKCAVKFCGKFTPVNFAGKFPGRIITHLVTQSSHRKYNLVLLLLLFLCGEPCHMIETQKKNSFHNEMLLLNLKSPSVVMDEFKLNIEYNEMNKPIN